MIIGRCVEAVEEIPSSSLETLGIRGIRGSIGKQEALGCLFYSPSLALVEPRLQTSGTVYTDNAILGRL